MTESIIYEICKINYFNFLWSLLLFWKVGARHRFKRFTHLFFFIDFKQAKDLIKKKYFL